MESEVPLPCLLQPATGLYTGPDESNPALIRRNTSKAAIVVALISVEILRRQQ